MAAIAIHHTATDEGTWDGPANEGRLDSGRDEAYYRRAFAWQDSEGDPTTKAAYRFIHHMVAADGTPGAASTRGCSAGIGVLNGGRGGTTIPDADRRGVYNHLAAHLRDADMEPPDLREIGDWEIEQRAIPAIEFRVVDGAQGAATIDGYAAVFNVLSEDLGNFHEIILPGAFSKTIQEADVRALWQHDPNFVLGRTRSKTLALAEDGVGLRYTIIPPDTQWARDALVTMRRGDVNQSSFAFRVIRDEWTKTAEDVFTRSLIEVQLFDVSPVTYPAYPQTSAQARSRVFELSQQGAPGQGAHPPAEAEAEARARRERRLRLLDLASKE